MMNHVIYYYHPLELSFKTAQTLQIIKDYLTLSKVSKNKIYLYGFYSLEEDLNDVLNFVKDSNITIYYMKKTTFSRTYLKMKFYISMLLDGNKKFIVTRTHQKSKSMLFFKKFLKNSRVIQELHEESFPYLLGKKISKEKLLKIYDELDGLIFTNPSQLELYTLEFNSQPKKYEILPNGVELEKFAGINYTKNHVLTYLGQFNSWKNVELLFASLAKLEDKFTLRIAGGKNNEESDTYINNLVKKYNLNNRVNYLGFVKNNEVVQKVIKDSNILLLPLGDNIQSKYLTSPMKLFEYMATNTPVIAVDYPTVNLLVSNNEIYFSQNDSTLFAKKIEEIVEDKNIDQKLGQMQELAKKYSYEKRAKKYEKFLDSFF